MFLSGLGGKKWQVGNFKLKAIRIYLIKIRR